MKVAVSAPVKIKGEGKDANLTPEQIAGTLVFEPGDGGALNVKPNKDKLAEAVAPQLKDTVKQGRKSLNVLYESGLRRNRIRFAACTFIRRCLPL